MERSRLMQARTLALRRQDYVEVDDIDAKLKELPVQSTREEEEESLADKLAKVNERNRKANLEAVRKAELLEVERKRRERKLHATGSGVATPSDPSARLRTIPRMFNDTSRCVLSPLSLTSLDFVMYIVTCRIRSPRAGQVRDAQRDRNARHRTPAGSTKFATYIPTAAHSPRGRTAQPTERQVIRSFGDRKHRS